MLLIFKFLASILKVLNSEEAPQQLAAGFAFGAWIGLMPIGLVATLFGLFAFLINVNLGILTVALGVFKLIAFLIDPVANHIGFALLTKIPSLHPFWTELYNLPIVPYTRFNNTIMLGSFVIGFFLLVPNYFLGRWLVALYRSRVRDRMDKWKITQFVKASSFYKYYVTFQGFRGE